MDPNTALIALLTSLANKETDDAMDYLSFLYSWLCKDGFCPKVERKEDGSFKVGNK